MSYRSKWDGSMTSILKLETIMSIYTASGSVYEFDWQYKGESNESYSIEIYEIN